jgi:hypothetical protein
LIFIWGGLGVSLLVFGISHLDAAGPDALQLRQGGRGVCDQRGVLELCVWPGSEVNMDASFSALVKARDAANPVLSTHSHFFEPGLTPRDSQASPLIVPSPGEKGFSNYAVEAVVPQGCNRVTMKAAKDLVTLIYERAYPGNIDPREEGGKIAATSEATQRIWVQEKMSLFNVCQP